MNEKMSYFVAKKKIDEGAKKVGNGIALAGLIVGIVILFLGVILGNFYSGLIAGAVHGGIIAVIGAIISSQTKCVYMSGEEYDREVKKMLKNLGSDPKEYLGLDDSEIEEIDPVSFEGYKFSGADKVRKDPKDGLWRSDQYEKVTIVFTINEVHIYKCFLNIISGKITETTDVMFYEDIVSVSTKNETEKIGNQVIEYVSFNLVSKGGNNMSVAINGNDNRQKSINAMRAMIKEKKTQRR